jgi:hypothetical protein
VGGEAYLFVSDHVLRCNGAAYVRQRCAVCGYDTPHAAIVGETPMVCLEPHPDDLMVCASCGVDVKAGVLCDARFLQRFHVSRMLCARCLTQRFFW